MFLHAENYADKSPNDVLSCLQHYIKALPTKVDKIELLADSCFSQNKNRYLLAFFHALVSSSRIKEVRIYYPPPGHSLGLPYVLLFGQNKFVLRGRSKKWSNILLFGIMNSKNM